MIDKVNQVHMSWQQLLHERDRPFLEGLREHSVIGVGEGVVDDGPCLTVLELLFIEEDSKQLYCRDRRMSII